MSGPPKPRIPKPRPCPCCALATAVVKTIAQSASNVPTVLFFISLVLSKEHKNRLLEKTPAVCPSFGHGVHFRENDGPCTGVANRSVVRGPWSVVRGPWSVVCFHWSLVICDH